MSVWYVSRADELLIDLDDYMRPSKSGCPWGEAFFRRRLRDAMVAGKLKPARVWLVNTSTNGHRDAIVLLGHSLPPLERLIWQLHLGSDLYRGRADLMRYAKGVAYPSLIILPAPIPNFYREPDFKCSCTAKHVTEDQMSRPLSDRCQVWQLLRGRSPWELFGKSERHTEKYIPLPVGEIPLDLILTRVLK